MWVSDSAVLLAGLLGGHSVAWTAVQKAAQRAKNLAEPRVAWKVLRTAVHSVAMTGGPMVEKSVPN